MKGQARSPDGIAVSTSRILLVAILLLAASVRLYRIDAQSLWNDEGNSARIAERSVELIVQGAAGDVHPPGYYLLLRTWRTVFGQSEFALRSLSAAAGLLLVALTYVAGRRLVNQPTGLTAAFLGAVSPFGVYYSQEARMYAVLAALSALSTLLAIRAVESGGTGRRFGGGDRPGGLSPFFLGAYVLTNCAGLYTHYAFTFMLVAHNVLFGMWWLGDKKRRWREWRSFGAWMAAQGAIVLLYLPWLPTALRAARWDPVGGGYHLGPALLEVLRVLTVGITLPAAEGTTAIAAAGLLMVVGLGSSVWPRRGDQTRGQVHRWNIGSLVIYLVVPLGLFFAFDLYKPAWLKFLVVLLLPFHVLLACGVDSMTRFVAQVWHRGRPEAGALPYGGLAESGLRVVILVPLVVGVVASLCNLAFDSAYFRDDYRQIAADIEGIRRSGDGIILNAPNQWEVFTYYYPDRDVYPAPYCPGDGEAERFVNPILAKHERLFVLYWGDSESDPGREVESELAERAYKARDSWYGAVRLATYGVAPLPQYPTSRLDVWFRGRGGELSASREAPVLLRGYALAATAPFDGGDVIPVTLFWEAGGVIEESYKVTVQLLDGTGTLVAQVDTAPVDSLVPTTLWQPGETVVDRYGILVPEDLTSDHYSLIVAVYHPVSGERLRVVRDGVDLGDHLVLTEIVIGQQGREMDQWRLGG